MLYWLCLTTAVTFWAHVTVTILNSCTDLAWKGPCSKPQRRRGGSAEERARLCSACPLPLSPLPLPAHTLAHCTGRLFGCHCSNVFDFSPLAVFAISSYMATVGRSAPLPERNALVEDPQFQEMVERSRSLVGRILLSIPDTHKSCIVTEVRHAHGRQTCPGSALWMKTTCRAAAWFSL